MDFIFQTEKPKSDKKGCYRNEAGQFVVVFACCKCGKGFEESKNSKRIIVKKGQVTETTFVCSECAL